MTLTPEQRQEMREQGFPSDLIVERDELRVKLDAAEAREAALREELLIERGEHVAIPSRSELVEQVKSLLAREAALREACAMLVSYPLTWHPHGSAEESSFRATFDAYLLATKALASPAPDRVTLTREQAEIGAAGRVLDWIGVAGGLALSERVMWLAIELACKQGLSLDDAESLGRFALLGKADSGEEKA